MKLLLKLYILLAIPSSTVLLPMEKIPEIGNSSYPSARTIHINPGTQNAFNWHLTLENMRHSQVLSDLFDKAEIKPKEPIIIETTELTKESVQLLHPYFSDLNHYTPDEEGENELYEKVNNNNCKHIEMLALISNYLEIKPLFHACFQSLLNATTIVSHDRAPLKDASYVEIDSLVLNTEKIDRFIDIRKGIAAALFSRTPALTYWLIAHAYDNRIRTNKPDETIEITNEHVRLGINLRLKKEKEIAHLANPPSSIHVSKNLYDLLLTKMSLPYIVFLQYVFEQICFGNDVNFNLLDPMSLYTVYEEFQKNYPALARVVHNHARIILPRVLAITRSKS